ncbi:MAG: hypothetical protein P8N02_03970 [Actinomycetota bacterium]|nr:hypothetical protein [Actinomycetota bacterium]
MSFASACPAPAGAVAFGPENRLCISWEGAERPDTGVGRPGRRSRRLLAGVGVALVAATAFTLGSVNAAPEVTRQVPGEGIGSVSGGVALVGEFVPQQD